MNRIWMPLYVADYLADTAHLSTTEHGAYLLLIMHYWTKGCLPSDEESIRRITRLTPHQWKKSRDVLKSNFLDGWRHKRIDEELAKALEKSKANSANAKRSHDVRRENAQRTHTQSQSHIQSDKEDTEAKASGADAPIDPSIAEREFFKRGREVLGKNSGGLLTKLKASRGHNVSLARAALETAATKENPAEYIAAVIRGPPAKPLTAHQQERQTAREILDDLDAYISRNSCENNSEILRQHPSGRPESLRGGAGGNIIDLPRSGAGEGGAAHGAGLARLLPKPG